MRFRRALDRGNVTEALSAASELDFVSLTEALELTLLLVDGDLEKYNRVALRWHDRFVQETKNVDIRESHAVLALLTAIPVNRLAAAALAELLSRRRSCEANCRGACPLVAGGVELRNAEAPGDHLADWRGGRRSARPGRSGRPSLRG
jgi:hypothetical protein